MISTSSQSASEAVPWRTSDENEIKLTLSQNSLETIFGGGLGTRMTLISATSQSGPEIIFEGGLGTRTTLITSTLPQDSSETLLWIKSSNTTSGPETFFQTQAPRHHEQQEQPIQWLFLGSRELLLLCFRGLLFLGSIEHFPGLYRVSWPQRASCVLLGSIEHCGMEALMYLFGRWKMNGMNH
jgi:hypothetical protein